MKPVTERRGDESFVIRRALADAPGGRLGPRRAPPAGVLLALLVLLGAGAASRAGPHAAEPESGALRGDGTTARLEWVRSTRIQAPVQVRSRGFAVEAVISSVSVRQGAGCCCGTAGAPTATPTQTQTPGGPTSTPTATETPGGPTQTPTPPAPPQLGSRRGALFQLAVLLALVFVLGVRRQRLGARDGNDFPAV